MNVEEAGRLVGAVGLLWPHSNLGHDPDAVVSMWATMLAEVDYASADAALRELAVGREHAPPVGVVLEAAVDRALGIPGWDEVWPALDRVVAKSVTPRGYRMPDADDFPHPYVLAFARENWRQLCPPPREEAMATHRAQMRDAYRAGAARRARDAALAAIGASRASAPALTSGAALPVASDR